jgi:hypothetical protein
MSWPAKKTWSTVGWSRMVTIWPARVQACGDLLVADADQAAGRHPASDLGRAHRDRLAGLDGWDRGCRGGRWLEAPGHDGQGDGLVGTLGVVVVNPGVQHLLGERVETGGR